MRTLPLLLFATLVACQSENSSKNEAGAAENAAAQKLSKNAVHAINGGTYRSPSGVQYDVKTLDVGNLPQNSDLKMANGSLVGYGPTLCHIDIGAGTTRRCDIYVQNDEAGKLIGYAALIQDDAGTTLSTATTLNQSIQPNGSCALNFKLFQFDEATNEYRQVHDAARDFSAQAVYSYWDKGNGEGLVSDTGPDGTGGSGGFDEGATGIWYIEKKAGNLRIQQENWNYCYRDKDIFIDDVFNIAASFVKK